MINFTFVVNPSFLGSGNRPITIPKAKVSYDRLQREGLVGDVVVVCPDGSRIPGQVYSGIAGYGPYYQLRITSGVADPLGKLKLGSELNVSIVREDEKTIARLSEK